MAALARPARPPDVPPFDRPITCDNGAACVGGVQRCVDRGGSEWGRAAPARPCVASMALHAAWRRVCPAGFVPPGVSVLPGPLSGGGGYLESLFHLVGQGSAPALCAHIRSTGNSERGGGRLRWGCEACNAIFGPSRRVSTIATTCGERDTVGGRTSTGRACLRACLSWTWTTDLPPTTRASLVYSPPV